MLSLSDNCLVKHLYHVPFIDRLKAQGVSVTQRQKTDLANGMELGRPKESMIESRDFLANDGSADGANLLIKETLQWRGPYQQNTFNCTQLNECDSWDDSINLHIIILALIF